MSSKRKKKPEIHNQFEDRFLQLTKTILEQVASKYTRQIQEDVNKGPGFGQMEMELFHILLQIRTKLFAYVRTLAEGADSQQQEQAFLDELESIAKTVRKQEHISGEDIETLFEESNLEPPEIRTGKG